MRAFPKHGVFVLYDTADEFQGLVAIVLLGGDERLGQDRSDQFGCCRQLEVGDEVTGGFETAFPFHFAANIG